MHKQFVKHMPVHLEQPIFKKENIRQKIAELRKVNGLYAYFFVFSPVLAKKWNKN